MISSLYPASWRCRRSKRFSSLASISSWTRAAAVMKPTDKPFWQAASPNPRAMWVFPVPLLPTAITLSRRARYSQRASSSTNVLLSEGIAVKSKLSRLFTVGNRASLMRRSTIRRSRSINSSSEAQQVTRMVDTLGGALLGELVVFAQERRQLERLKMMGEHKLGRVAHDEAPARRSR